MPEKNVVGDVWYEIQDNPNLKYFGVFVDRKLVSSCTLSIVPNLTRGCRPYGVIENVVTHADYRRRGYASGVLKHTLGYAWHKGCYKVMLLTGRKDEGVFRFYEGAGFRRGIKTGFIAYPPEPGAV